MQRIAIIQQIVPKYRVSFFNELYKKVEFELYTSNKGLESSIETVFDNINARINLVKNFIFINKINFQFLPFFNVSFTDTISHIVINKTNRKKYEKQKLK